MQAYLKAVCRFTQLINSMSTTLLATHLYSCFRFIKET